MILKCQKDNQWLNYKAQIEGNIGFKHITMDDEIKRSQGNDDLFILQDTISITGTLICVLV